MMHKGPPKVDVAYDTCATGSSSPLIGKWCLPPDCAGSAEESAYVPPDQCRHGCTACSTFWRKPIHEEPDAGVPSITCITRDVIQQSAYLQGVDVVRKDNDFVAPIFMILDQELAGLKFPRVHAVKEHPLPRLFTQVFTVELWCHRTPHLRALLGEISAIE